MDNTTHTVQVEYLFNGTIDLKKANITKREFERLPFKQKEKMIKDFVVLSPHQCTDIEILTRIDKRKETT